MATKIPQNIDKEDKLVGPLTLKQFLYLLGGAALTFIAYQYYAIGYLFITEFVVIGLALMALAVMLAFVQINGRPFITFLASLGSFLTAPKQRFWHKNNHLDSMAVKLAKPTATTPTAAKSIDKSQLEKLATILDTGGKMEVAEISATHEINNLGTTKPAAPPTNERDLGVEDVLSDTEV
ncbi:MAG: PrgI family protein [Patescibacteria group bacterium]|jgi:hypothetical protein